MRSLFICIICCPNLPCWKQTRLRWLVWPMIQKNRADREISADTWPKHKKDVSVHFDWRGGEKCANGLRGGGEGPKYLYYTIAEENSHYSQAPNVLYINFWQIPLQTKALDRCFSRNVSPFFSLFLALGISFLAFVIYPDTSMQDRWDSTVCVWWLRGWGEAGSNTAQTSSFLHIHDRLSVKHCKDPDLWSVKARVWKIEIPSGN